MRPRKFQLSKGGVPERGPFRFGWRQIFLWPLTKVRASGLSEPMAATPKSRSKPKPVPRAKLPLLRRVKLWAKRIALGVATYFALLILLFSFVPPPINLYQLSESLRLGSIEKDWVSWEDISPVMGRSVVAAEDANFCQHWGFDLTAIRAAVDDGGARGGSTISQQVAKNVLLWQGRSYVRKALEALLTPVIELVWSKQRILEVYLNVAEFDEGVFGVQAASQHYFGVDAGKLSALQAARLAAILPAPKERSASKPTAFVRKRTGAIMSGAETIQADGRAACFQNRG
jgi:monofunctional glycosyltransferase